MEQIVTVLLSIAALFIFAVGVATVCSVVIAFVIEGSQKVILSVSTQKVPSIGESYWININKSDPSLCKTGLNRWYATVTDIVDDTVIYTTSTSNTGALPIEVFNYVYTHKARVDDRDNI